MIKGSVRSNEARIRLKVKGGQGQAQEINAVIDSGYTGSLSLPPALIAALNLPWQSMNQATLADGSTCVFQVFAGKLHWDGKVRAILVDEADTDPLVGMKLLRGHELKIQVRARGEGTIKRLRQKSSRRA